MHLCPTIITRLVFSPLINRTVTVASFTRQLSMLLPNPCCIPTFCVRNIYGLAPSPCFRDLLSWLHAKLQSPNRPAWTRDLEQTPSTVQAEADRHRARSLSALTLMQQQPNHTRCLHGVRKLHPNASQRHGQMRCVALTTGHLPLFRKPSRETHPENDDDELFRDSFPTT